MPALLKSDLVWKFVGGFVIGTVGVLTLGAADARMQTPASSAPAPSAPVSSKMIDATR